MGAKSHVTGDKMSVTDINDRMFYGRTAKRMSRDLLGKYGRLGDNIETAAYRVHREFGVDPKVLQQGWNREPRPMLAHRWFPLFWAWVGAGFAKADEAYEAERSRHDDTSALVRLADLVAGKTSERED